MIKQNGGGEKIFIDAFYYGNIEPQSSELNNSKMFRKKMEVLAETEKELLDSLKSKELDCLRNTLKRGHLSTAKPTEIHSKRDLNWAQRWFLTFLQIERFSICHN